jgi:hypothetical protein
MIRQGDTHVSALLPSGKNAPHPSSYYKKREGSVVRELRPSLGQLEAAIKPITLRPLAGTRNEGAPIETLQCVGLQALWLARLEGQHEPGILVQRLGWDSLTRD